MHGSTATGWWCLCPLCFLDCLGFIGFILKFRQMKALPSVGDVLERRRCAFLSLAFVLLTNMFESLFAYLFVPMECGTSILPCKFMGGSCNVSVVRVARAFVNAI